MRIAFAYHRVAPEALGGAERYYARLCSGLAATGEDVTYLTRKLWDGPRRILRDEVELVAVAGGGRRMARPEAGELIPKLVYSAKLAWHLLRRGGSYDVVHVCCFPYPAVLAARVGLCAHRRTRLVVDWHEVLPASTMRGRRGRLLGDVGAVLQGLALRAGDAAVSFSKLHADRLRERPGAPPVHLFPEFLPTDEQPPSADAGARARTIVFAGRLVEEKGAHHLPGVLAILREEDPAWQAVVFGTGPAEQRVREAIAANGVQDSVRMAGFAPWSEVSAAFATSAALVFPSVREGFGLVVLEAAAHGLPVVLIDAPDNAAVELVEHRRNGIVVGRADSSAMAEAVLRLAGPDQPKLVRDWFQVASQRLSLDAAVSAHARLHRELVGS